MDDEIDGFIISKVSNKQKNKSKQFNMEGNNEQEFN